MKANLKEKLSVLLGSSLEEQRKTVLENLIADGFKKVAMPGKAYDVTAYVKQDCQYVVIALVHKKRAALKDSLCVIDREGYEELKNMFFSNNLRGKEGCKTYPRIQVTGDYKGKRIAGANVCEMVCPKTKGQVIDHRFHSTMINTKEAVRACTVQQNNMNKKGVKSDSTSEYAYKPEEDFSRTWFAYIYWRALDKLSEEEVHEYNREVNK